MVLKRRTYWEIVVELPNHQAHGLDEAGNITFILFASVIESVEVFHPVHGEIVRYYIGLCKRQNDGQFRFIEQAEGIS